MAVYIPREPSLILTLFVLNLDGWLDVLPNKLYFYITLLYYYINIRSSITLWVFPGGLFFSLGISVSVFLLLTASEVISGEVNQTTSCFCCLLKFFFIYLCIYLFWSSFKCICSRLFNMIKKVFIIFTASVFAYFFIKIFFAKDKSHNLKYSISKFNLITHHFLYFLYLNIWVVNNTSMYENSELNVFRYIKFLGEISNNWLKTLFGGSLHKTLEFCW